jgi:hypothetical protein
MVARSCDLHLETGEGSGTALILSALYPVGHDWQTVGEELAYRILNEVFERGLLRDDQFGFRTGHSTSMQLARLVKKNIQELLRKEARRRGVPGCGQSV